MWNNIAADFSDLASPSALSAFGQVVLIDVMLAADNAIVVGALAAGLPAERRRRVILVGVIAALLLRVAFALLVTLLLRITGLVFAGGVLLLWIARKMWNDLRAVGTGDAADHAQTGDHAPRSFASAAWAVAIADVSMSLDNVLAVAGAARAHPGILALGLILSVALMGLVANGLARVIERHRWLGYVGLLVILYIAGRMIVDGLIAPSRGLLTLF